ncbi:MAG: hypothetical protein PVF43_02870 [Candidatus Eiseniibacteriota bacterium]|jgi:tetratricopeptide (TPR) repeat protein
MLDANGETTDRWLGYTKEMFLERLAAALADPATIAEKEARFAARPNVADARTLARYHDSRSEYEPAIDLYRQAGQLDPDGDYSMEILSCVYNGLRRSDAFGLDDVREAADAVLATPRTATTDVLRAADMMAAAAMRASEPEVMVPYLSAAFRRSDGSEDPAVQDLRQDLAPLHALYVAGDPVRAVELKRESMPDGWLEDDGELNSFAWWCFEHRVNLDEALELALKGVGLAEAGARKAMILDTAAELASQLGRNERAVELIKQAVREEPDNSYYRDQRTRFEALLAANG